MPPTNPPYLIRQPSSILTSYFLNFTSAYELGRPPKQEAAIANDHKSNPTITADTPPSPADMIPIPPPSSPVPPSNHRILKKPTTLPDVIFTALSLFVLFSTSPKPNSLLFLPNNNNKLPLPLNLRRFPKMSLPFTRSPRNPGRLPPAFATPQSLSDWLKPRMCADLFGTWGVKPGTKNIHNLWLEIAEGETSLADSTPPVRTVEVVVVRIIGNGGKILIESHQELSNGVIRDRCRPLSEKMKPGESVESAVFRALKEELGSFVNNGMFDNVKILPGSYVKKVEERVSASYPGLPACYVLHRVDTEVYGLPDGDFCTEESEEYGESDDRVMADGAVSCKKHYWRWVDSDSL